jgi:stalled ribosome rescue protein Dom34
MDHQHAAVWIDHREARIVKFGVHGADHVVLHSNAQAKHLHHKANSIGDGRAPKDTEFFERVAGELNGIGAVVIVGPSSAKNELADDIRSRHPALLKAIKGVEPLDHPTEGELLNFARSYLNAAERVAR